MYGTTHDYVLDGTNIIRETVTGGGTTYTLYYLYDESGSVQGFIYNNNYYYYQKNLQGDVIRILIIVVMSLLNIPMMLGVKCSPQQEHSQARSDNTILSVIGRIITMLKQDFITCKAGITTPL